MDMSFEKRLTEQRGATPAPLDFIRLAASIAASQAASPTAAIEARLDSQEAVFESHVEALIRLLDARSGWVSGIASLGGSFHPRLAATATIRAPDTP